MGKRSKIILLFSVFVLCLSFPAFSFVERTTIKAGYCSDIDGGTPLVLLENDLVSGDFIFGTAISAQGEKSLAGYESFMFRYVEYDDGVKGLFYGQVENMRFGYGLLLNDFNTV